MDLRRLEAARQAAPRRVSLATVFVKAYGLLAAQQPVLRQLHFRWPVANVYQHDKTVLMMPVAREFREQPWLFWGRFSAPEQQSLLQLQQQLERFQQAPVGEVFRKQLQLSSLPTPVRRLVWWSNLNLSGPARARRTGTAFLSTLAGRGASIQHPPSFQTGCLTYGPFDDNGRSLVTLSYDHRLMDGAIVAECLQQLEAILRTQMAAELQSIAATDPPGSRVA